MTAVPCQNPDARQKATVGAAVLGVVRELAEELHSADAPPEVALDRHLELDLALHSIERLELACRIEQRVGVRLPDEVIANAETVDDVVRAVGGWPTRTSAHRHPRTSGRVPRGRIGAPVSAVFTGYVAILLLVGMPVVWLLLLIVPHGRPARRLLRRASRTIIAAARFRIEVDGLEHLSGPAPMVLMANHQSYLDAFVLLAVLPVDMTIVINEKLPRVPLLGSAIRAARYLVVNRRAVANPYGAVDAMAAALRSANSLLVFPEGTTTESTRMLPLRLGGFAAAVQSRRPIVPLTVAGTRRVLPAGRWMLGRRRVSVTVHPAVYPVGTGWAELLRLRGEVAATLASTPRGRG